MNRFDECPVCGSEMTYPTVYIGVGMQQCGPAGCEECHYVEGENVRDYRKKTFRHFAKIENAFINLQVLALELVEKWRENETERRYVANKWMVSAEALAQIVINTEKEAEGYRRRINNYEETSEW